MQGRKLTLSCPVCGSPDVVYSCEPKCCFNHVCSDCGSTFEPVTRAVGQKLEPVEPPDPPPDSTDPTVACALCRSTRVYVLEDGRLACAACGQALELELTEICPS
jgi:transcription elongation factor Elf1